jgi:hypothetical protein
MGVVVALALVIAVGGLWRARRKRRPDMATIPIEGADSDPEPVSSPPGGGAGSDGA